MNEKKRLYLEGLITGVVLVIFFNAVVTIFIPSITGFGERTMSFDRKMNTIYSIMDAFYVEDYDRDDIEEGMFLGMVYGLGDRYSTYMDKVTYQSFIEQTDGSYAGIGAGVEANEDGGVLIVTPYVGAPAYTAGIQAGDVIKKVNGIDITGTDLDVVVSMMKGEPGTTVNLTIFREIEGKTFDVDVIRAQVNIPTVTYRMIDEEIGYVHLLGFEGVTYDQFVEALEELINQGMKALVLDIRNNPGGRMDTVVNICNELLPEGVIVYTEDKNGEQEFHFSEGDYLDIPLTVLVNGSSASASEVLSGAVKDYNRGAIIGEQTFGKGVVQGVYPLNDGSAVKVTIARYYTPNGICIHGEGVTPDYYVPMEEEKAIRIASLSYDEDNQLQKAVEVLKTSLAQES